MNTVCLDSPIRHIAIASINGYQKYISPHKGFACAHRLLYGGESCSQYVKRLIYEQDLMTAIKASRQRFKNCRGANQILKSSNNPESEPEKTEQKPQKNRIQNQDNCAVILDPSCCQCGVESLDCCGSFPTHLPSCDFAACGEGCSGMDCVSGFDCSGLDCGSCG